MVFARAHLRFWVRRLTLPLKYATSEVLTTADGSHIELRRLPVTRGTMGAPLGAAPSSAPKPPSKPRTAPAPTPRAKPSRWRAWAR